MNTLKTDEKNKTTQFSVRFSIFHRLGAAPTFCPRRDTDAGFAESVTESLGREIEMKSFGLALALAATAISATAAFAATDIRTLDTNGDRFASYEEFTNVVPGLTHSDFRVIDVNDDRRVSSPELQTLGAQAIIARYAVGAEGLPDIAAVDTNGDTFVSFFRTGGRLFWPVRQ